MILSSDNKVHGIKVGGKLIGQATVFTYMKIAEEKVDFIAF